MEDEGKITENSVKYIKKKDYSGNYCIGKNRHNQLCNKRCNDEKYCNLHDYMKDYTEHMLNNLKFCKGCLKWKYLEDNITCDICRDRCKLNREKVRESFVKCKFVDEENISCTFKSEPKLNNGYCGKHQVYFWKEDQEKDGKNKVCTNFIRGCRNVMGKDEEFSRCLSCREKNRVNDKERNDVRKEKRVDNNSKIREKNVKDRNWNDIMYCSCCKADLTIKDFLEDENNIESKLFETCKKCREKDLIRESKEERKEYKQNLENTPKVKLCRYKKGAKVRDLDFELEKEEFDEMIQNKCHYCGEKDDIILNGVDRLDSNIGYNSENCVSCCNMCNYLKRTLSKDEFLNKIKHIMSNIGYGDYKNPELFKNHNWISYDGYKKGAKKRLINFNIDELQFNKIIMINCYICNKESNNNHVNGIDRIDSSKNYDLDNILPCCGDCNIMKNDFILEDILVKFFKIYKRISNNNEKLNINQFNDYIKTKKEQMLSFLNDNILDEKNYVENKKIKIKNLLRESRVKYENKIKEKLGENEYKNMLRIKKQYQRAKKENDIETYNKLVLEYQTIRDKMKE